MFYKDDKSEVAEVMIMKKFFWFLLAILFVLILASCDRIKTEVKEPEEIAENTEIEENDPGVQIPDAKDFVPDEEKVKEMLFDVPMLGAIYPVGKFCGFSDSGELSSDQLINFLIFRLAEYDWKNEDFRDHHDNENETVFYSFEEEMAKNYLSDFFENVNFSAEDITLENYLPVRTQFDLERENVPLYGIFREPYIAVYEYNAEDRTLTVEGGYYGIDNEEADGSSFTAVFKANDDRYLWRSFDFKESETFSYEQNPDTVNTILSLYEKISPFAEIFSYDYEAYAEGLQPYYVDDRKNEWYLCDILEWDSLSEIEEYLESFLCEEIVDSAMEKTNSLLREIDGKLCFMSCTPIMVRKGFLCESLYILSETSEEIKFCVSHDFPDMETCQYSLVKGKDGQWVFGPDFAENGSFY